MDRVGTSHAFQPYSVFCRRASLNHSINSRALCAMEKICDKDGISFENSMEDVQRDHLVKQTFVGTVSLGRRFLHCWAC